MIEFSIHKYYVDSFQNIKYDLVKDLKMFNNQTKLLQCIGVMKNLEFGKINESFKNSVFLQILHFQM